MTTRSTPPAVAQRDDSVRGRHGPIPIRRYGPADSAHTPLVWLHGGGFSRGSLDQAESHAPAAAIAATGRPVVTVDYRLVPRQRLLRRSIDRAVPGVRYPVPLEDVLDVLERVQAEHGATFLGGASAGACLAAAAAVRARAEGEPAPAGLVLAYGLFHSALPPLPDELRSKLRGVYRIPQFTPGVVDAMCRNYAGSAAAMHDPFAFPGGHDVRGLPPALFLDAERDSLRASGGRFAEELTAAGVDVSYHVVPGCLHGFLDRPAGDASRRAVAEVISWLDRSDRVGSATDR